MKKILSLLICLSLILAVSGCAKIEESWRDITGSDEEITPKWTDETNSGVSTEEKEIKESISDKEVEVPDYKSNAIEFTVNDARFGSRNMTTRYEKVNVDYQKFVDGIVKLKDSVSDEEMLVASKDLAELLNDNLNMGLTIDRQGIIKEIDESNKDIYFGNIDGYNFVISNRNTFQSSISLECSPMNIQTKSEVLEFLKPFGEKLGIDLFEDSDFVKALNGISSEVPMDDMETKEYNNLSVSIFDDSNGEEVLIVNILGKVEIIPDGSVPYYLVQLTVKLSQPRYEDIKAGL